MSDTNMFSPAELTKEKRLWDVYRASRRIRSNRFNVLSTLAVFLALTLHVSVSVEPLSETLQIVRSTASSALAVALSTLGFLLAGFTVFATISQPSLSLRMAEMQHPQSGLSWLKHNYFIFLRVFIYYLVFSVFCLLVVIFGHKGGLLSVLVGYSPNAGCVKFALVKASYVLIFTGYYFLLMQLKSFIFNVHHSVMTALRWKAEGHE